MSLLREFVEEFAKVAEDNRSLIVPFVWSLFVILVFLLRYILIGICVTIGYQLVMMLMGQLYG